MDVVGWDEFSVAIDRSKIVILPSTSGGIVGRVHLFMFSNAKKKHAKRKIRNHACKKDLVSTL